VSDPIKASTPEAIAQLHKLGLKIIMLTGDNERTANAVAKTLGLDEVAADVEPKDKHERIQQLRQQGKIVAMAGDGINDAPALHAADVGISVDGSWCHAAFALDRKLHFPLLSDFEPKGGVARRYGAYRDKEGVSERALFVIDPKGTISWSYLSPVGVNPGADGILDALEALESKK